MCAGEKEKALGSDPKAFLTFGSDAVLQLPNLLAVLIITLG